jgi:hypothetical protein
MKLSEEETTHTVLDREWLSAAETLKVLNRSQSTLDRLVAAKDLASKVEPRAGRKPERLYKAEDVQRIAKAAGETSRAPRGVRPPTPSQLAIAPEAISSLRDVTAGWGNAVTSSLRELMTEWLDGRDRIGAREKLWLTIDEAVELSGRSRAWLLRVCQEGQLTAEKDGGWRILRRSLEVFTGDARAHNGPRALSRAGGAK